MIKNACSILPLVLTNKQGWDVTSGRVKVWARSVQTGRVAVGVGNCNYSLMQWQINDKFSAMEDWTVYQWEQQRPLL